MSHVSAVIAALSAGVLVANQPALQVGEVVQAAGRYAVEYQRSFSVVVSRESYQQRLITGAKLETRDLRSEVALVALDDANWILFRDVYEVDGRPVADRRDRLTQLFLKPTSDLGQQARRILEEGARYNLGPIVRTLNTPTQALDFIRPQNQSRSSFRLAGRTTVQGVEAYELRFEETAMPRMIVTRDNAAASGRFWVAARGGTIVKTELRIQSGGVMATISVHYSKHDKLSLWVPSRMTESYEPLTSAGASSLDLDRPAAVRIDGTATYTDFRQFSVDTSSIIR
jgi:hypothetical protein